VLRTLLVDLAMEVINITGATHLETDYALAAINIIGTLDLPHF